MAIDKTILDRRTFMRGTAAAAAALPLGGLLGSTGLATGAFAQDAANPFAVADGSTVYDPFKSTSQAVSLLKLRRKQFLAAA